MFCPVKFFLDIFNQRYGICYPRTKLGSLPVNIVNTEITTNAISGDYTVDSLLDKWDKGLRIEYEKYFGLEYIDVLNTKFNFVKR